MRFPGRGRVIVWLACFAVAIVAARTAESQLAKKPHNFDHWEKEVAAYEARDRASKPAKGGIVFAGSSVIRLWKSLPDDFPGVNVINRGVGGSEIADATHFADRLIFPHEPRQIILRAGGNDIHHGRPPEEVFDDFKAFVAKVRNRLPDVEIAFIAVNPAPSRSSETEKYRQLNGWIREYLESIHHARFIDAFDVSLASDGQFRRELFVGDMLHFNGDGYKLLADRVRPALMHED